MANNFLTKYDVHDIKTSFNIKKVMSEHSINCKKAELKVLTESGTDEDFYYLYQESMSDAIGKLGEIIDDIIKKFIEFCKDVQIQILSKINSVEFKSNVQKINDKLKFNPFLRSKSQTVSDFNPKMKDYIEASSKLAKMVAKLKSGNSVSTEIDNFADWFDDLAEKQMKQRKLSNAAIFATLKSLMEKVDGEIKKIRDDARDLLTDVKGIKPKKDDDDNDINLKSSATKLCNYISRVSRAAIRLRVTTLSEYLAVCKREILNAKEEDVKNESYEYEDSYDSDYEYDYSNDDDSSDDDSDDDYEYESGYDYEDNYDEYDF